MRWLRGVVLCGPWFYHDTYLEYLYVSVYSVVEKFWEHSTYFFSSQRKHSLKDKRIFKSCFPWKSIDLVGVSSTIQYFQWSQHFLSWYTNQRSDYNVREFTRLGGSTRNKNQTSPSLGARWKTLPVYISHFYRDVGAHGLKCLVWVKKGGGLDGVNSYSELAFTLPFVERRLLRVWPYYFSGNI